MVTYHSILDRLRQISHFIHYILRQLDINEKQNIQVRLENPHQFREELPIILDRSVNLVVSAVESEVKISPSKISQSVNTILRSLDLKQ